MRLWRWSLAAAVTVVTGGCVERVPFGDDRGPEVGSLVGYWKLDEASGAVAADASGRGNHGSYEGSPVPSTLVAPLLFANPGSLAFDQNDAEDVSVPASPTLGLSGPLTLAAWIHPAGETTTQQGIIDKWDIDTSGAAPAVARGYEFRVTQERTLRFLLLAEPGQNVELVGTSVIASDVWTHVAATFDGRTLRLFVNGGADAAKPATTAPIPGSSPLHIGRDYGDNGFQGNIDEVRVYSRALGADEVLALARGEAVLR
jgi:hypothetical protein